MDTPGTNAAMDMAQFQGAFFEEAAEHLADMESRLVRIDLVAPTGEELDAIFRAAHSIKGGSGMFGFKDATAVTHELESLLDRVRKRDLALRSDMVDTLLAASDLVRAQLAHYAGHGAAPAISVEAMCQRIRACMSAPAAPAQDTAAPVTIAAVPAARTLEIAYPADALDADAAAGVHEQLRDLGKLELVPATARRKRRKKGEPPAVVETTLRLATDADEDLVRTLFEFVMDSSTVRIAAIAPAAQAQPEPAPAPAAPAVAEADQGFGFFVELPAAPAAVEAAPAVANPASAPARAARRETERNAAESSIRVSIEKVDQLINQVGELVITQSMLAQSVATLDPMLHQKLLSGMADLERNTRDLQESVMSIRMMPMAFVFNRFPRLVRDLAAQLHKQVQLATAGEATELDKGLIEKISDPLTHLVRNAIDHGIEPPAVRLAAGKPSTGTVTLRAAHQGGNILIEVVDDGAGLDRARILAKARERGMAVSDSASDQEVWGLIFEAGFSTAAQVTNVSGRGVGMDVVKRNIASLGGIVEIDSVKGIGTRMTVRLPLTLAIMDGMSVAVGAETYILPLAGIVESLQVRDGQVRGIAQGGLVIEVRGEYLPVVSLHSLFVGGPVRTERASGTIVIVESDGIKTALLVDELIGQHQVVVKSLDANYKKVHGISGATIMGDGRVALILDVATLTRKRRQADAVRLQ